VNLLAALRSAWRALGANALRSVLTMLGIIIGVAAVITMIAVGRGATERVQAQMKGLGSNIMLVLPGGVTAGGVRLGAQTGQALTEEDAQAIALEIPGVQVAAPTGAPASSAPPTTTSRRASGRWPRAGCSTVPRSRARPRWRSSARRWRANSSAMPTRWTR
jgi:hypothetical protein